MSWIKQTYKEVNNLSLLRKKQVEFAFLFAFIFMGIGTYIGYKHSFFQTNVIVLYAIGFVFLLGTLLAPSIFRWPLLIWLYFGKVLGEITSTIILGVVYFLIFTPITLIKRLFQKKVSQNTGWVKREDPNIDYKKLY